MIRPEEFLQRRKKIFDSIEDNSVLILYAGIGKKRSEDENHPYMANRNFYYLTNIKQEGSIYVLVKYDNLYKEFLFVQPYNELKEKWTGKRLTINEASEISKIDNVLTLDCFDSRLDLILNRKEKLYGDIVNLYLDLDKEQKIDEDKDTEDVASGLKANYPYLNVKNIYRNIMLLRMVKSKSEIEEFKEAIAKTNIGLKQIMKNLKPDLYEYQMSSLFFYTIQDYDYSDLSFPTIAASGVNATCLHYPTPTAKINNGDLMLFDLGAKNNEYCADISRTYPVNGRFNPLQAKIYRIVLGCNKMVIETVKPGITLKELNDKVIEYLANECLKAGLINDKADISKYYFHGVSHHIGLDTHDCSDRTLPLQPGNIISDEPGLYFKELGIGVRIEDDILVTEDGALNLSGNILKEIEDIEKAMQYQVFEK